jgi:signal transduction histidine kinase
MTSRRGTSLQTRLLLTVGLVALAAIATVALAGRLGTRYEFRRFQDVERRAGAGRVDALGRTLSSQLSGRCCSESQLEAVRPALGPELALFVLGEESGKLLASLGAPLASVENIEVRRQGKELSVQATRRAAGGPRERLALQFVVDGHPVTLDDGGQARLFVVPIPNERREREAAAFLGSVDRYLVGATVLIGLLALGATWLVSRRTLRPIEELRAATRELSTGRFDRRVEPSGGREVADLADAFNRMADELERQHSLRRHLVTDVAHELRTPLTALQCRIETLEDGLAADPKLALEQARAEIVHLGRLVDDLQELALAEARELRLEIGPVSLRAVLTSATVAAGVESDRRVTLEAADEVVARCDAVRARQMALNLLTNASRYTPADGTIKVRVEQRGSEAAVVVSNTGSRLTPEEAACIFDRFYRTDPSRQRVTGGTGLGLAIVKHLAEAQGGRVWAESDETGVTVGFALPAQNGAAAADRP